MKVVVLFIFLFSLIGYANSQSIADTLQIPDSVSATSDSATILTKRKPEKIKLRNVVDSILSINPIGSVTIFPPITQKIEYTPTLTSLNRLKEYQDSLSAVSNVPHISTPTSLQQMQINYMVQHPEVVQYTWREVPEPWKNIREGRTIRKDKRAEMKQVAKMLNQDVDLIGDRQIRDLPKEEESPWKNKGEENLQMSQLHLDNWAKGGESSLSFISDFRYVAKYFNGKHQWESNIVHKLGFTHTSTLGTRVSDDVLDLSSKYGYQAVSKWYYSFLNTVKTQLFRNYANNDKEKENPKSAFFSPAYIQFIFGMDYKNDNFSLLLSPYTAVMTVVMDTATIDQTAYSISENRRSTTVDGFSITLNWKKNITNDITYTTKGELFYEYFEKDGQKRFDWENIVDLQINRFLTTRFLFELRYYDNESDKFQVKENISISFKYSF